MTPHEWRRTWEQLPAARRDEIRSGLLRGEPPRRRADVALARGYVADWQRRWRRRLVLGIILPFLVAAVAVSVPLLAVGVPPAGTSAAATFRRLVLLPAIAFAVLFAAAWGAGLVATRRRIRAAAAALERRR